MKIASIFYLYLLSIVIVIPNSVHAETVAIASTNITYSIKINKCGSASFNDDLLYFYINDLTRAFDIGVPDSTQPNGIRISRGVNYFIKRNKFNYALPLSVLGVGSLVNYVCGSSVEITSIPSEFVVKVKLNKNRTTAVMSGDVKLRAYHYGVGKLVTGVYGYKSIGTVTILP